MLILAVLFGLGQPAGANSVDSYDLVGVAFGISDSPVFGISELGPGSELGLTGVELLNSLTLAPDRMNLLSVGRFSGGSDRYLIEIDLLGPTGTAWSDRWLLNLPGANEVDVRALAFDAAGTLFLINDPSGFGGIDSLYRIDPEDIVGGVATVDGTLYGARDSLFEIDPSTGAFTEIGPILDGQAADVRGLNPMPVPEPGTWALLALALGGLPFLRRRGL
jgi:hypothetical protein